MVETWGSGHLLKDRQIKHWIRLFLCKFDEEYLAYALKIGQIHYEQKVPPYLYMGGYSFIQCEIISLASSHYSDAKIRSSVLTSINRLIAMDVDIAMSAYTRQHWLQTKQQKKKTGQTPAKTGDETRETVFIC